MTNTTDDDLLANLMYEPQNSDQNDSKVENTMQVKCQLPTPSSPQILQTKQNTQNNQQVNVQNIQNQCFPIMPQLYFPHSNVTINYNFGNK